MTGPLVHVAESAVDLETVRRLFRAYGDHLAGTADICIENFDAEIASLPGAYLLLLLATVHGEPAGCIALKPLHRAEEQACELKRLWVGPSFRGHKLGRLLMEAAIAHARRLGCTALYLDTLPAAMPEANRLYEALGFTGIERYNANPVEDAAFFRLALAPERGESG